MALSDTPKLLTVAEVHSKFLSSVSKQRVYQLSQEISPQYDRQCEPGQPRVVVRLGRQIRINEAGLIEFLENGGAALRGGWRSESDDA